MKCDRCDEEATYILWRKGTKDKNPGRRGGFAVRDPKVVCAQCRELFPYYEIVYELERRT